MAGAYVVAAKVPCYGQGDDADDCECATSQIEVPLPKTPQKSSLWPKIDFVLQRRAW